MSEESSDRGHLQGRRKTLFLFVASGFFLVAFAIFLYWFFVWRFEIFTNDAYVNGNQVELNPQVAGIVAAIYADNTDYVEAGEVIIALDPTDYALAFEKSQAALGEAVRRVEEMFAEVETLRAYVKAGEADLIRAAQDFINRVDLVGIGAVAKEEFEHTETTFLRAHADLTATRFRLRKGEAQVVNTTVKEHPLVMQAIEKVRTAWVDLQRCQIISPVNGYITQRSAQLGEFVERGKPLLAIVPLGELWVDANFKETKLSKVRVGQVAQLTADLYGKSVVFYGCVVGINPGTGSVFSALPPQNATGNWIKIVQRVPVRISLQDRALRKHPLWLGLSMNVHVDITDQSAEMLSERSRRGPIYATELYAEQQEGVEMLIEEIIAANAL